MKARDLSRIDEQLLIAVVRRMIAAIGLPNTLLLLETWGGTYLYLPQGRLWRKARGALAELIGETAADAFHAEFADGSRRILLPKADKLLLQLRDQEICDAADEMSVRDQALHYRLTTRQIQNIRRKGEQAARKGQVRRATNQFELFPALGTHSGGPGRA